MGNHALQQIWAQLVPHENFFSLEFWKSEHLYWIKNVLSEIKVSDLEGVRFFNVRHSFFSHRVLMEFGKEETVLDPQLLQTNQTCQIRQLEIMKHPWTGPSLPSEYV